MSKSKRNQFITILIIEDNVIIGENLRENVEQLGYEVVGVARNDIQAYKYFDNERVDLIIADIHLKGCNLSGIDIVVRCLDIRKIPIIYLTAFNIEKYKNHAKLTHPAAYLIKPASLNQIDVSIDFAISSFCKTLPSKHSDLIVKSNAAILGKDEIFVKKKNRYEKIIIEDIVYLKADRAYTQIYTGVNSIMVSTSMKNLSNQISKPYFIKTHRSYVVNRNFIHSIDDYSVYLILNSEVIEIPIGASYKENVYRPIKKLKY